MGLLVTLYLISSNVYSSLKAPIQRGFSYIEIFLFGTQGVIFFAILEYGFVLAWKKYSNIWNDSKPKEMELQTNTEKKKGSCFDGMSHDLKINIIDDNHTYRSFQSRSFLLDSDIFDCQTFFDAFLSHFR